MKFVSEEAIDAVLDQLEEYSDEQYERAMEAFSKAQPYVFAYLFSEDNFHLLTEEEKGYVQYLGLVAWLAVRRVNGDVPPVDSETIGEAEERNYERLETTSGRRFEERLEAFFDDTNQEALLSFAVEAVTEDGEEEGLVVTPEGRETVFVAVKTVIDVLTKNAS
ncbi:MAG: hypothetical protein RMJ33_02590 [Saprospiraceae bacterium]|nr:hypothetical protein [Saprospiraceae bacterium]MDW8228704.1 hypothetical protein [Saprospiraceae bacterium]